MNTPAVTAFAETSALYHVLNGDLADARAVVEGMLPSERADFAGQLDTLRSMLTDRFGNDRSKRVPDNPKGPGEVTVEDVKAYPYFYISGEGREAAEASRCEHNYLLTSSCPVCP